MPGELSETMSFFGVGNHGGGLTRQHIEHVQALTEIGKREAMLPMVDPTQWIREHYNLPGQVKDPTGAMRALIEAMQVNLRRFEGKQEAEPR